MAEWQTYYQTTAERFSLRYLAYLLSHNRSGLEDLTALTEELPNLLEGMQIAHRYASWDAVLDYAGVLCRPETGVLGIRGYWLELYATLTLALDAAQRKDDSVQEGALWQNMAVLAMNQGQMEQAWQFCERALEKFGKVADDQGRAQVRGVLGTLSRSRGDYKRARIEFEKVLQIFTHLEDHANMAVTYSQLGRLAEVERDPDSAYKHYQADLALEQSLGNERGVALALWGLGNAAYLQGDLEQALERYYAAWDRLNAIGDKRNIAGLLGQLANLTRRAGNLDAAAQHFWQVVELCQELGDMVTESLALFNLASLYREQGDLAQTVTLLERVVEIDELAALSDSENDRQALAQARNELNVHQHRYTARRSDSERK